MSPQVEAAIIAGCFGVLTLIGTVVAQIIGCRSTRDNTERQIKANRDNTAATLKQQREQLNTTLKEQRDALDATLNEQRTRTLNERFATAADHLGSDKPSAVRLAGVYAMAGLADDWDENRQTCVNVLCAYLRMPYEPDPGEGAPGPDRLAFRASCEVRHTVIRVITAHLKDGALVRWRGLNLDFTGVISDGGNFAGVNFSGGEVNSVTPSSLARSTSAAPSSPAARSAWSPPSFRAARSTSPTRAIGHSHPNSPGQASRPEA